ncbi:hypothetical protein [Litoribacillus peritrichatus]|uniref:Lipoprotein n=1 Tax=Litoribacillus peritrichatus TaxID=718191 RepID=A0ABP7LYD2_9GAMM
MKLHMLLIAASIGLAGCEVHHIHHFNEDDLAGCNCNKPSAAGYTQSGQSLPHGYGENVKVLPPIYQPILPYGQPMVQQAPPQVQMPEYYKLTPVDPNKVQGQQAPAQAPMSYSPYYQPPVQPVQQPVMPIQMSSNSAKQSDGNIRTYLFQPAGGVVYQY